MTQGKLAKQSRGYLLLETLISIVMLGMIVVAVFPTVSFLVRRSKRSVYDTQASLLLQEGLEVAYNVFFTSSTWDAYLTDGRSYKPVHNGAWSLIEGTDVGLETRFDRTIVVNQVCRDAASKGEQVICPAGTVDPNSKNVVTTVIWEENGLPKSITASLLLLRITE